MEGGFLIVLIVYLIHISTFSVLINVSQRRLRTALIHFSIQIVYSLWFVYNMNTNGTGGVALVYFVYLIITLAVHWLVYVVLIIWNLARKRKADGSDA